MHRLFYFIIVVYIYVCGCMCVYVHLYMQKHIKYEDMMRTCWLHYGCLCIYDLRDDHFLLDTNKQAYTWETLTLHVPAVIGGL